MVGNNKAPRQSDLQWYIVHAKFNENLSISSKEQENKIKYLN
jgi:hypothetical protein